MNKEYPIIKVENKNLYYADILLFDYTSSVSELTATNQYVYQSIYFKKIDNALSKDLLKISITEMHHLGYLGETISLLGRKPVFKSPDYSTENMIPWDSNYINYTTDIKKMLIHNIKIEKQAIKNYEKHIKIIKDIHIQKLLNFILKEEYEHIKIFEKYLTLYQ